jgi:hypothetical protein
MKKAIILSLFASLALSGPAARAESFLSPEVLAELAAPRAQNLIEWKVFRSALSARSAPWSKA